MQKLSTQTQTKALTVTSISNLCFEYFSTSLFLLFTFSPFIIPEKLKSCLLETTKLPKSKRFKAFIFSLLTLKSFHLPRIKLQTLTSLHEYSTIVFSRETKHSLPLCSQQCHHFRSLSRSSFCCFCQPSTSPSPVYSPSR